VLAHTTGVLEPWQTARSVAGQVRELRRQIDAWASPPVVLVGHSWGAWLSVLLAVEHPESVRRLVLIGSAPFRARDALRTARRRSLRLSSTERAELSTLWEDATHPRRKLSPRSLRRLTELFEAADAYDPVPHPGPDEPFDPRIFSDVWPEAERLRSSGALERSLRRVKVPVLVLHGREDPHPSRGVVGPLRQEGVDLRVVVFDRCGHEPWWERHARAPFFRELRKEIARA
jgi:pimeloyl-ACP methyl ester carboxylesterase